MARKFLYLIASLIVIVIAVLFIMRIWSDELSEIALVPSKPFIEQQPLVNNAYHDPDMWFSRPGIGLSDPARWQPAFAPAVSGKLPAAAARAAAPPAGETPAFAVFFIHPTSHFNKAEWNAPIDDKPSQDLARVFIKGMASPFNKASEIWAPRYRQATFGSFLTDDPQAGQALDAAYHDVDQAFSLFLDSVGPETPIVLVGHSQGAVHLLHLLRSRIAGTDLQPRIAAAYAVGWPVSIAHDLPSLGLPACAAAAQSGCLLSWLSFAEPADSGQMLRRYRSTPGFDGKPRGDGPVLCTNPITGIIGGTAPESANLGTLVPNVDMSGGELVPSAVPARCDARGLLLIGNPPKMGPGVLPGNNYHVYDIPLFWRNTQEDVLRRVKAWTANR